MIPSGGISEIFISFHMFADNSPERCKSNIRTQRIAKQRSESITNQSWYEIYVALSSHRHTKHKRSLLSQHKCSSKFWEAQNSFRQHICNEGEHSWSQNSLQCLLNTRTKFHNWKQTTSSFSSSHYSAPSNFKAKLGGWHGEFGFHDFMVILISIHYVFETPPKHVWHHFN